ncbi:MAG: S1C family serine protease [Aggregatilineales bacterium]
MTIRKLTSILSVLMLTILVGIAPIAAQDTLVVQTDAPYVATEVYERVAPSVVAITAVLQNGGFDTGGGSGSGFVIDTEGHIITNNHVVEGADYIELSFFDGTLAEAQVIGLDPDSDLAVLRVDLPVEKLIPVEFADSNMLITGQPVFALGSPFGQEWTLTQGIISALGRTIRGLTDFSIGEAIQTDAPINPGNSGGPLLDTEGRVIGVNSQILSRSGSNSGIGFAIPGNLTQRVADELIQNGFVSYSYLGISGGDVNLRLLNALNLPNDLRGVVIASAAPGGPAARADVQNATNFQESNGAQIPTTVDIVTAIDGEPVESIEDLIAYLARSTKPGDTVTLTVVRNGSQELQLDVRLTPRPVASSQQ